MKSEDLPMIRVDINRHDISKWGSDPFNIEFRLDGVVPDKEKYKFILAWLLQCEHERYCDSEYASNHPGSESRRRYDKMVDAFSDLALHIQHFRDKLEN